MKRTFTVIAALAAAACHSSASDGRISVDVGGAFPAGTALRDAMTGAAVAVGTSGAVLVAPGPSGVVLLERDGAQPGPFTWPGATVYFAITDRFLDGDPANDRSYGTRPKDGADEVGTWHGGDFNGLTQKLDYLSSLGVTALWISPVVEQVHGWVAGGTGDFKHYGYHGYWALDFTRIDANFGTPAELGALVDAAHQRGIRVLIDVVMNHPGYATGDDLLAYLPGVFTDGTGDAFRNFQPTPQKGYGAWNDLVNYGSANWAQWWGVSWIRAGLGGGYQQGGADDLTKSLTFLPDFKTESASTTAMPPLFTHKTDTGVADLSSATVRQYLVKWHSDWVRQYGIDGFRCDTAKNVELASWKALKDAATTALADWKALNPAKKIDDAPFWMTGEVFPHGVVKDAYFTQGGFDSVLNFDFQQKLQDLFANDGGSIVTGATDLEAIYAPIAALVSTDPGFDVLSYISSHDTKLFFDTTLHLDAAKQRQAGTALLLAPGGVQVFYGDESGRKLGPSASDPIAGTRSDMNWTSTDTSILEHWKKLGAFRKKHPAVGGGAHQKLTSPAGTYAFSRKLQGSGIDDAVVVVLAN